MSKFSNLSDQAKIAKHFSRVFLSCKLQRSIIDFQSLLILCILLLELYIRRLTKVHCANIIFGLQIDHAHSPSHQLIVLRDLLMSRSFCYRMMGYLIFHLHFLVLPYQNLGVDNTLQIDQSILDILALTCHG